MADNRKGFDGQKKHLLEFSELSDIKRQKKQHLLSREEDRAQAFFEEEEHLEEKAEAFATPDDSEEESLQKNGKNRPLDIKALIKKRRLQEAQEAHRSKTNTQAAKEWVVDSMGHRGDLWPKRKDVPPPSQKAQALDSAFVHDVSHKVFRDQKHILPNKASNALTRRERNINPNQKYAQDREKQYQKAVKRERKKSQSMQLLRFHQIRLKKAIRDRKRAEEKAEMNPESLLAEEERERKLVLGEDWAARAVQNLESDLLDARLSGDQEEVAILEEILESVLVTQSTLHVPDDAHKAQETALPQMDKMDAEPKESLGLTSLLRKGGSLESKLRPSEGLNDLTAIAPLTHVERLLRDNKASRSRQSLQNVVLDNEESVASAQKTEQELNDQITNRAASAPRTGHYARMRRLRQQSDDRSSGVRRGL